MRKKTEAYLISEDEWALILDGEIVAATWNSKGAAEAAIEVERERRRKKRAEKRAADAEGGA